MVRIIAVLVIGALLAFQVVRSGLAEASASAGSSLWSSHPNFELPLIMAEIGAASARGDPLPPALLGRVDALARRKPLAPEPFLIKGALAQAAGQEEQAERLFLEALGRDPRSRVARYFLAERYLRSGRIGAGLNEIAVFSRLTNGAGLVAPALAQFARTSGGTIELKRLLLRSPELEPLVLAELASDAANLELIMALRSGSPARPPSPDWRIKIVNQLIAKGDMAGAHDAWAALAGVDPGTGGLYNPRFDRLPAPPPFNWAYGTAGGVAEPLGGGRLQLIYYGREDAILAEQLMVLEPGRYRFAMEARGDLEGSSVGWSLACEGGGQTLFRLPLDAADRAPAAEFQVPQGCSGQRLRLAGTVQESPRSMNFTVGKLSLTRVAG